MTVLNGGRQMPDVWRLPSVGMWEKRCGRHPTQKPLKLIERIIEMSTNEGDVVLDACMGSGTTAVACMNTNRNFIGFELNKEYFDIAINRIKESEENKKGELW